MVECSARINRIVVIVDYFDRQFTVTFLISERRVDHVRISEFNVENLDGETINFGDVNKEMTIQQVERYAEHVVDCIGD